MAIIFLYLALLAVAFFVLIVRPQRRQMAARRALIASLEVGDEVITAGGIYGTVRELTDTTLLVEVAPGVMLTLAREAVSGRPPAPPAIDLADTDDDEPTRRPRPTRPLSAARRPRSTIRPTEILGNSEAQRLVPERDARADRRHVRRDAALGQPARCSASTSRAGSRSCSRRSVR